MNTFTKALLVGACLASASSQAQVITYTAGTSTMVGSPVTQINPDNVYEIIYRKNQLNQGGNITRIAFEKTSGTALGPLDHVKIYLKHTTLSTFAADGPIDTTGYVRVFKGAFTNATASGFQEVVLNRSFAYDNVQNLAMFIIRQGGTNIAPTATAATWLMGTMTANGTSRRYTNAPPITATTQLLLSQNVANLRLTFGAATATREDAQVVVSSYPNPATTHFTVQLAVPGQPATAHITDALGRTVRAEAPLPARNGEGQVGVANLPAGLYLLHVTQNQRHSVQRFVKE